MSRTILYTGGSGRMGVVLRDRLRDNWDAVRLYSRTAIEPTYPNETSVIGALDDLDALTAACDGVDVVVHLAGIADETPFPDILEANITGTYTVFEAALRAGVTRVVYASSNHVIGRYPSDQPVDTTTPLRPDSYYGVSKVFGEALGRLYADKWGLGIVCLRIGSFREAPENRRQLATWLSHRDGAELLRCAVDADATGFLACYGISANARAKWFSEAEHQALGYRPADDAEDYAGRFDIDHSEPWHGGIFAEPDYTGGSW